MSAPVPVRLHRDGSPSRIAAARRNLKEILGMYHTARAAWYRGDRDLRWRPATATDCLPYYSESYASEGRACEAAGMRFWVSCEAARVQCQLSERGAYEAERKRMVESRLRGEAMATSGPTP